MTEESEERKLENSKVESRQIIKTMLITKMKKEKDESKFEKLNWYIYTNDRTKNRKLEI